MLDSMEPRALGEHPSREDALHLAGELDLIHFHEGRRMGPLGRRTGVANARSDLERAELDRPVHLDLKMGDTASHLVERSEDRDGVLNRLRFNRDRPRRGQDGHRPGAPAHGP